MNIIILSNIIGFVAVFLWVISVQLNKKKQIIITQLFANIFYAIQYLLLGVMTAGILNIVSTIRCYIYERNEGKGKINSLFLLLIFIFAIIIIGIVTYSNLLSLIPIAITILYTYVTWQKNMKIIRIGFLIAAFAWIYYNFSVNAYASIIGNLFEIISGMIAIYRFDIKKQKNDSINT